MDYERADDNKPEEEADGFAGCVGAVITFLSYLLILCTLPFSLCVCVKQVQEYERAVIFRLGRVKGRQAVGPGLFFIVPCIDNIMVADLRTISFDVPPQEILTKDSVTVSVDAVVYFKVSNPMAAVCNVSDYARSTRLLASTTLRNILGNYFNSLFIGAFMGVKITWDCHKTNTNLHVSKSFDFPRLFGRKNLTNWKFCYYNFHLQKVNFQRISYF